MTTARKKIADLEAELKFAQDVHRADAERLRQIAVAPLCTGTANTANATVNFEVLPPAPGRVPAEARQVVLAVAIRLEERADAFRVSRGSHIEAVEDLRARAEELRELVGEPSEEDETEAEELLQELLGTTPRN